MTNGTFLITGGTGSFGNAFVRRLLDDYKPKKVIVFSRDELKQFQMAERFGHDPRLRFFIGDIRDKSRLLRAFEGVDFIVHAAALKRIEAGEYNPGEFLQTNVLGTQNVVDAAIDRGVKRALLLSTDKACAPINTYGKTKALAESLFIAGNSYAGSKDTRFACLRYGNVFGSRGSLFEIFERQKATGEITITDERMSRFWLTLEHAVDLVFSSLDFCGGEIIVPQLRSLHIIRAAKLIAPECKIRITGIRPGEKLHECLLTADEARNTVVFSNILGGVMVKLPEFSPWGEHPFERHPRIDLDQDYTSQNAKPLTDEDFDKIIKGVRENKGV